jgi:hypothetical protein
MPTAENFAMVLTELSPWLDQQVLVRNLHLSGEVIEIRSDALKVGPLGIAARWSDYRLS